MVLPVAIVYARRGPLERIGAQVVDRGGAQLRELALPRADRSLRRNFGVLLQERDLPVADAYGHQVSVVAPVEELFARRLLRIALEERQQVLAVEMNLEVFAV